MTFGDIDFTPKNHATAAHAAAHTPDDKGQQN